MDKLDKYKNAVNNMEPSESLIQDTLNRIDKEVKFPKKHEQIIKKVAATIATLFVTTGCVFATVETAKTLDLGTKFSNFFGISEEEANKIGVSSENINLVKTVNGRTIEISDVVSDGEQAYIYMKLLDGFDDLILERKNGFVFDETECYSIKKENGKEIKNYYNIYYIDSRHQELQNNNEIIIGVTGISDMDLNDKLYIRFEIDKSYFDFVIENSITTYTQCYKVNKNIKTVTGESYVLKTLKISPISISYLLQSNGEQDSISNGEINISFNDENYSNDIADSTCINIVDSYDGKYYRWDYINFTDIQNIKNIESVKFCNLELNLNELEIANEDEMDYYKYYNTKKEVYDYITQDKVIFPLGVGSSYGKMFVFNSNGKFAMYDEKCILDEDRDIIYKGTFKIEEEKLILQITERLRAEGGKYENCPACGSHLCDYEEVIEKCNINIEYNIETKIYDGITVIALSQTASMEDFEFRTVDMEELYKVMNDITENGITNKSEDELQNCLYESYNF